MRNLKFRAWNIDYLNPTMEYFDLCDLFKIERLFNKEIMEFTGMKDKKGKGIYEGDIILTKYNDKPFVVYWSDEYLAYYIRFADTHENKNGTTALSLFKSSEYEVIGNVFENPDLIIP